MRQLRELGECSGELPVRLHRRHVHGVLSRRGAVHIHDWLHGGAGVQLRNGRLSFAEFGESLRWGFEQGVPADLQ
jgi:hypothetical protein